MAISTICLCETMKVFKDLEINVDPKAVMSTMSVSQRQMVEIAKAVSYNSKIIVFDEPTSSLTEEEVEHLFRIINMLRDRGCGIIYISHKMEEILRISLMISSIVSSLAAFVAIHLPSRIIVTSSLMRKISSIL